MRGRDRIAVAAIAVTCAISALAVGSATRWTALAAAALGLGCGLVHLRSRGGLRGWPPLVRLLVVGLALTAIQLVPLTDTVLSALTAKGELLAGNAAALEQPAPSLSPITYDAASTWLELAKLVGYLGFAVCCLRLAGSRRGRIAIAAIIAATGTAVALAHLGHELIGARSVFGLYTPRYAQSPPLMGPFLNPNHLAGVMALAAPIAAALAIDGRGRARLAWAACAAVCAAVGFLSQSRTGALSLLSGLAVLAALVAPMLRGPRRRRLSSNQIAIGLIAVTAIAVAVLTIGRGAIDELTATQLDELTGERGKVALWIEAARLIPDHPWTGVGRGAFQFAFASSDTGLSFSHVENAYLQVVIDYGLIGALFVAVAFVLALRVAARRVGESLVEAGLGAGLLAILVHQLADFTLELPGAGFAALAAFAALSRAEIDKKRDLNRRWRIAAVVAGAAAIGLAASPLGTPARVETDALAANFTDGQPREALDPAVATWRRHPGDFIAAAQVSEALFARGDRRAAAVINRALALNPAHSGLHLIAARMLRRSQRPEQALVEYAAAIGWATKREPLIRELVASFPDPQIAARGLPIDRRFGNRTLAPLARLDNPELGYHYATRLIEVHPNERRFHRARVAYALQTDRIDAAVESGEIAAGSGQPDAILLYARALAKRGDHAAVEAQLTALRERAPPRDRAHLLAEGRLLAAALRAQNKLARAAEILDETIAATGRDHRDAAPLYHQLAEVQEQLGDREAAAVSRARAESL